MTTRRIGRASGYAAEPRTPRPGSGWPIVQRSTFSWTSSAAVVATASLSHRTPRPATSVAGSGRRTALRPPSERTSAHSWRIRPAAASVSPRARPRIDDDGDRPTRVVAGLLEGVLVGGAVGDEVDEVVGEDERDERHPHRPEPGQPSRHVGYCRPRLAGALPARAATSKPGPSIRVPSQPTARHRGHARRRRARPRRDRHPADRPAIRVDRRGHRRPGDAERHPRRGLVPAPHRRRPDADVHPRRPRPEPARLQRPPPVRPPGDAPADHRELPERRLRPDRRPTGRRAGALGLALGRPAVASQGVVAVASAVERS